MNTAESGRPNTSVLKYYVPAGKKRSSRIQIFRVRLYYVDCYIVAVPSFHHDRTVRVRARPVNNAHGRRPRGNN